MWTSLRAARGVLRGRGSWTPTRDHSDSAGGVPEAGRADSHDNALAETIIGLYKTELVYRRGPWSRLEDIELATLAYVWWLTNHRLLKPLALVPPAEFEQAYFDQLHTPAGLEPLNSNGLR